MVPRVVTFGNIGWNPPQVWCRGLWTRAGKRGRVLDVRRARKEYRLKKQAFLVALEEAKSPTPLGEASKLKLEALAIYGKWCVDCHNEDPVSLELDHTENDGKSHRYEISGGKAGEDFYRALKRKKWPDAHLETVCKRCHNIRTAQRRIR